MFHQAHDFANELRASTKASRNSTVWLEGSMGSNQNVNSADTSTVSDAYAKMLPSLSISCFFIFFPKCIVCSLLTSYALKFLHSFHQGVLLTSIKLLMMRMMQTMMIWALWILMRMTAKLVKTLVN